jgi:hypothetical protein
MDVDITRIAAAEKPQDVGASAVEPKLVSRARSKSREAPQLRSCTKLLTRGRRYGTMQGTAQEAGTKTV